MAEDNIFQKSCLYLLLRLIHGYECPTMAVANDYQFSDRFGDEGCVGLCEGLKGNTVMLSLSLCYCDLGVKSGAALGELISTTAIRSVL